MHTINVPQTYAPHGYATAYRTLDGVIGGVQQVIIRVERPYHWMPSRRWMTVYEGAIGTPEDRKAWRKARRLVDSENLES